MDKNDYESKLAVAFIVVLLGFPILSMIGWGFLKVLVWLFGE